MISLKPLREICWTLHLRYLIKRLHLINKNTIVWDLLLRLFTNIMKNQTPPGYYLSCANADHWVKSWHMSHPPPGPFTNCEHCGVECPSLPWQDRSISSSSSSTKTFLKSQESSGWRLMLSCVATKVQWCLMWHLKMIMSAPNKDTEVILRIPAGCPSIK